MAAPGSGLLRNAYSMATAPHQAAYQTLSSPGWGMHPILASTQAGGYMQPMHVSPQLSAAYYTGTSGLATGLVDPNP